MKRSKPCCISKLAEMCDRGLDEVLLTLWDAGFDEVNGPNDVLVGNRLEQAKRVLSLPTLRQLTSLTHWQKVLSLEKEELLELLADLGFELSPQSKRLPQGALRKLSSEARKRKPVQVPAVVERAVVAPPIKDQTLEWKTIGHVRPVRCLSLEEVLAIHYTLVADFAEHSDPIDPPGPRNDNIIASAVFRQHTCIGDQSKYPTAEMAAAALLHSIVHDHPFHNGNKRTALVSTLVLLDENNLMLTCNEDEMFRFVLQVAQHKIVDHRSDSLSDREVLEIAKWAKNRTRVIERGERPLPFRKLRTILNSHGCNLEHSKPGSNMKITRTIQVRGLFPRSKTLVTNLSYGGEGREVLRASINKIRKDLELDEAHGIDSAAFYDDLPSVASAFIASYRKTLTRLARL